MNASVGGSSSRLRRLVVSSFVEDPVVELLFVPVGNLHLMDTFARSTGQKQKDATNGRVRNEERHSSRAAIADMKVLNSRSIRGLSEKAEHAATIADKDGYSHARKSNRLTRRIYIWYSSLDQTARAQPPYHAKRTTNHERRPEQQRPDRRNNLHTPLAKYDASRTLRPSKVRALRLAAALEAESTTSNATNTNPMPGFSSSLVVLGRGMWTDLTEPNFSHSS